MKVAFVAPFYGPRASGGAEAVTRSVAMRLAKAGLKVDVFTTCILDLVHDWNVNYHPQGTTNDNGVSVHRFRMDYVDYEHFRPLNERIMAGETLSSREEARFISMHVNSFGLYRALAAESGGYDWMAFVPYLFGNYPEFEGCLERLTDDTDLSRRMGDAGRDYVLENFAWDRVVNRYQQLSRTGGHQS